MSKLLLILVALFMIVGISSATVINATSKELVIAGETPNFYGIIITNTSDVYVTGYPTNLPKTLDILNEIDLLTSETITEIDGIIT